MTMLAYVMRYRPGWWMLHVIAVGLTFWLGATVRF